MGIHSYRRYKGEIGITTFRNALRAHYLPHSNMYVSSPSITIIEATDGSNHSVFRWKTRGLDQISNKDATILYCMANGVKVDYAKLIWEDIIQKMNKKTREKVFPYPKFISLLLEYIMPEYDNEELTINPTQVFSVHNWALKPNQTKGPPFTDHMKAICNLDVPMDSKAPKPSSQTEEVPRDKKPKAKGGLRRKQSSKHTSESKTKASKSKIGQSEKDTQSSSAKDKSPSHPLPPTLVVGEMHKEVQQAAGGPTSLGATSEDGVHPQLSSADSTAEDDPRNSAPNDYIPPQQDQTKSCGDGLKLPTLIQNCFFTPDSPQDEPIIDSDESEEEVQLLQSQKDELEQQKAKAKAEPELSKLLASCKFASYLPTKLKELPLKFTKLSGEIKELKQHVKDMEIELPGDLKEIPTILETFTSTISSLTSHVVERKNIQWELPTEFQALPILVSSIQKQLKTLDSFPSLLNKVTKTLNKFATMVENASGVTTTDVPSAGQATASLTEREKNTKDAETNLQNELVDLLGIDVVEQYHNKKLLFDKYCDKMLKRIKISKIINCDVLTQKGPISLKVYREDETIKFITNFKFNDLHLDE
ncbi:hypothetical protein Tco_0251514 [Tanacetum coccineum]